MLINTHASSGLNLGQGYTILLEYRCTLILLFIFEIFIVIDRVDAWMTRLKKARILQTSNIIERLFLKDINMIGILRI